MLETLTFRATILCTFFQDLNTIDVAVNKKCVDISKKKGSAYNIIALLIQGLIEETGFASNSAKITVGGGPRCPPSSNGPSIYQRGQCQPMFAICQKIC